MTPAPTGGFFVYSKNHFDSGTGDNYEEIWKVPFGGGTPAAIISDTTVSRLRFNPVLSPDGSKVAFLRSDATVTQRLYVCDIDGSNETDVAGGNSCFDPQWNPAGTKLVYRRGNSIRTVNADGTGTTTVVGKLNLTFPRWSNDGTKIAYMVNPAIPTVNELWVVNADGTGDTKIVANAGATGLGGADVVWLNGSNAILYPHPGFDVWKVNSDGTGDGSLTTSDSFWAFQGLTPDDSRLYVTDDSTFANWRLAYVDVASGGTTFVSPTLNPTRNVRDGVPMVADSRVYTVRNSDDALVSVALDGSDLRVEDTPLTGPVIFTGIHLRLA